MSTLTVLATGLDQPPSDHEPAISPLLLIIMIGLLIALGRSRTPELGALAAVTAVAVALRAVVVALVMVLLVLALGYYGKDAGGDNVPDTSTLAGLPSVTR